MNSGKVKAMNVNMDFNSRYFQRDGRATFLVTGEFPYYRTDPAFWADRLDRIKRLGVQIISCYIPWNLHEFESGRFDFDGSSGIPQRDVKRFGRLVSEAGMKLIAKPGPFICAEYRNGAIPAWLVRNHPEILMRNVAGKPSLFPEDSSPLPGYLDPLYLSYVERWYNEVAEELLLELESCGTLLAVQIENEIPYSSLYLADPFSWGYEPETVRGFQQYLAEKYSDCHNFQERTGISASSFEEIKPPLRPETLTRSSWILLRDWMEFKEDYAREVLDVYSGMMRKTGIDAPFYHDLVMLENESPTNYRKMAQAIPLAVNFWLENHPAYDSTSYCRALARVKLLQAAQPQRVSYCSESNWSWGNELEYDFLFRMTMPYLDGANIYTILDGDAAGKNDDIPNSIMPEPYPGQAAIDVSGNYTAKARNLKELAWFLNEFGEDLVKATERIEVALINYEAYSYPQVCKDWAGITRERLGMVFTNLPLMRDWLLKMIGCLIANEVPFDLHELQDTATSGKLNRYRIMFAPGYDLMAAEAQKVLVQYVKNGGILVIFPALPRSDESLAPCDYLAREFFGDLTLKQINMFHNLDWEGFGNTGTLLGAANVPADNSHHASDIGKVLARLPNGTPVAYEKSVGHGKVILIGLDFHRLPQADRLTGLLLKQAGVDPGIRCNQKGCHVVVKSGKDTEIVFMINRTPERMDVKISVKGTDNRNYFIESNIPGNRVNILHFRNGQVDGGSLWGVPVKLRVNEQVIIDEPGILDQPTCLTFIRNQSGEIIRCEPQILE